jgi:hypothetical protein
MTPEHEKEIREVIKNNLDEAIEFYGVHELLAEIDSLRAQATEREITNQKLTKELIELEIFAQERDAIRRKLDAWDLSREISNLREKTKALSISLLEENEGELQQLRSKLAVVDDVITRSKLVVSHWHEFGSDGFEEAIHYLESSLAAIRDEKVSN